MHIWLNKIIMKRKKQKKQIMKSKEYSIGNQRWECNQRESATSEREPPPVVATQCHQQPAQHREDQSKSAYHHPPPPPPPLPPCSNGSAPPSSLHSFKDLTLSLSSSPSSSSSLGSLSAHIALLIHSLSLPQTTTLKLIFADSLPAFLLLSPRIIVVGFLILLLSHFLPPFQVELLLVLLFISVKFDLGSWEEIIDIMIVMRLLFFGALLSSLGYALLSSLLNKFGSLPIQTWFWKIKCQLYW